MSSNLSIIHALREKPIRSYSDDNTSSKRASFASKIQKLDSRVPSFPPVKAESSSSKSKSGSVFTSLFASQQLPARRHSLPHVAQVRSEPERLLIDKQRLTDARLVNFCNKLPEAIRSSLPSLLREFPSLSARAEKLREELPRSKQVRKLQELDLSGQSLLVLPDEIHHFGHLRTLNLSNNRISTLPSSIRKLKWLESLHMDDCSFKEIPLDLYALTSLHILSIKRNDISLLSPKIGELKKLRYLLLSENKLVSLPKEFCNLWKLKVLDLGDNRLLELPARMIELDVLEMLFVNNNHFPGHVLPKQIEDLHKLIAIYIDVMQNSGRQNSTLLSKISNRGCVLNVT